MIWRYASGGISGTSSEFSNYERGPSVNGINAKIHRGRRGYREIWNLPTPSNTAEDKYCLAKNHPLPQPLPDRFAGRSDLQNGKRSCKWWSDLSKIAPPTRIFSAAWNHWRSLRSN